jgi:hypothetical protein
MKYEFSWDSLQMELTFKTPKGYDVEVSERFDFHPRDLEELEIHIVDKSYFYWPADNLRETDITETFIANLAKVIDDHFIDDEDVDEVSTFPDLHEIKRDGTCGRMSAEKVEQKTKEEQERIERRRYINEMLVANQTRHSKSPVSSVTAEDILKIIRINNTNSMRKDLFVEQPVIPEIPVEYKKVIRMEITGGPYLSFSEGSGVHPWKLCIVTTSVPINSPTLFYLVHQVDSEEIASYKAVFKLPIHIRAYWTLRCWLYNLFQGGEVHE